MPKLDLSHFDPNKTHAIKVNVYKPEGVSSFWKRVFQMDNKKTTGKTVGLNVKLNLEKVHNVQMEEIIKKVQNIDKKNQKKLSNFGNILRIKKHGIDLTKNPTLKEEIEKLPQIRTKQFKANFVCPIRKCVISSSSMSVTSRKGTVTTNMKYRFIQTTKLKKSPQCSSTHLKARNSSNTVRAHQARPSCQNILLQSVPSAVRIVNTQRKIIKPAAKTKRTPTFSPTKPQQVMPIPDEGQNVNRNILPSLITKIESMEKQISGIQNIQKHTKQVVSEKKVEKIKKAQSASVISHKVCSKPLTQTRKVKRVKTKKLKPKSKTVTTKNEGFKLKYPVVPTFHFNSCSESSNGFNAGIGIMTNPEKETPQILTIKEQEFKFPVHIPNTDLAFDRPNNKYELLLNFFQTLSEIKTQKHETATNSFPLLKEIKFEPGTQFHDTPAVVAQPDSGVLIPLNLNLVEGTTTDSKENLNTVEEPDKSMGHITPLEAEINSDQTDSLEPAESVLNSAETEPNETTETPQTSEVSIEANTSRNSDENNEILREILNFTKLIISKLELDPVKFPTLVKMRDDETDEVVEKENTDVPIDAAVFALEEEMNASTDNQVIINQEPVISSTTHLENDALEEFPPENHCEVETKASKESVVTVKSDDLDTGSVPLDSKLNITILMERKKKEPLKTGFEFERGLKEANEGGESESKYENIHTKPLIGPEGDHAFGKTNNSNNSDQEEVKKRTFDSGADDSFKSVFKSSKQNFYTKLETIDSINLRNYSIENQGTYLDSEKRKAFDKEVQALKSKSEKNQVQKYLNSVPISRKLSGVSNSIEPYEQFIETSFVSKQTSYSKTKFNLCQEKSFHQPFGFHNSSFPAIECVTSENKVDVTAKYTSKQHIIHHRKSDQSSYGNFESLDNVYKVSSRNGSPLFVGEGRSNINHRGNKVNDVTDLRRRACRFNLTLQQDRILEEKDDDPNLKKCQLNEVQAEKGDFLVVQSNYENQSDSCKLIMNQLEDDKVSLIVGVDVENIKPSNDPVTVLTTDKVSTAVQTDLSLFEGFVNNIKASSSCQFNEIDNFYRSITTQTETTGDQISGSADEINVLKDEMSNNEITDVIKIPDNDEETLFNQEKKEHEEDMLTIKIQKGSGIKVANILIGIIQDGRSDSNGSQIYDALEGEETKDVRTSSLVLPSNLNKSTLDQDSFMSNPDNFSIQHPDRSRAILEDLDQMHHCSNPCLFTISEETVKSNLSESNKGAFCEESNLYTEFDEYDLDNRFYKHSMPNF